MIKLIMRHEGLKSLVSYNGALVKRELVRNVIIENYGIVIDSILSKVK